MTAMLFEAPVTAILPVIDMDRARAFYEGKLGLRPGHARPDGEYLYEFESGARIALHAKAGGTKADHTAISFSVQDIISRIGELESRGVVFEDYDLPGLKTVNHVCVLGSTKAAWFRDSEGNYLCLHEDVE